MTTALEPFSVDGFRELVDQSLIGTVVYDAATRRVIYVSRSLAEICGRPAEKMIGIELGDLVHPDDREAMRQRGRERADGTAPVGLNQLRIVRPDGTVRDVETQGALRTIDGRDLIVVSAMDVTERERTRRVLNQITEAVGSKIGQEFFSSLVLNLSRTLGVDYAFVAELMSDPGEDQLRMIAVAADGAIAEPIVYAMADTPCETVVGSSLCWFPSDVQRLYPKDELLVAMGVQSYAGIPLQDSAGRAIGLLTIMNRGALPRLRPDEAALEVYAVRAAAELERRQAEKALVRSAAEWKQTFDNVHTPILLIDHAGAVLRGNRAACDLAALDEEAITGRTVVSLGEGEPWQTAAELVKHIAAGRAGTSAETKDQRGRTWDLNVAQFRTLEGEAQRFILVFWEITGVVELQESLRRSETMSAMGTVVAGVAHEVRNPLFGISATLDAYHEELSEPAYAVCAAALRTEVDRLKRLMQELLDYGRPGMLSIEKGSFAGVVQNALDRRSTRHCPVLVMTSIPATLPPLLMDSDRLQQVFENLIDNAVQHSPDNGVVTMRASVVEHAGRNWIECTVEDRGAGFDEESIDRAFEPFFTKRDGGTGLGLSIVQRFVEEHSGKVFAGNAPGGGAMVRVRLPLAEPSGAAES
jgi:PAS domain S-box-containing protein